MNIIAIDSIYVRNNLCKKKKNLHSKVEQITCTKAILKKKMQKHIIKNRICLCIHYKCIYMYLCNIS